MGYILLGMLFFASLIGLAELLRFWEERWITRGTDTSEICILPLKGHMEQAEGIVRSARRGLYGKHPRFILCDCGIDEETREICYLLCKEYPGTIFCTKEELPDRIFPL